MEFSADSLKDMRKRLGWSVFDLARRLGCDSEEIVLWESGKGQPNKDNLNKLFQFKNDLDFKTEQISSAPLKESTMREQGVSQLSDEELETIEE